MLYFKKKRVLTTLFLASLSFYSSGSMALIAVINPGQMSQIIQNLSQIVRGVERLKASNNQNFDKIDQNITRAAKEKKAMDEDILKTLNAMAVGLETTTKASLKGQQALQDGLLDKQFEIQQKATRTALKLKQLNDKLSVQDGADTCFAESSAKGLLKSDRIEKINKEKSIAYQQVQNQGDPGSQEELTRRQAAGLPRGRIVDETSAGRSHSIDMYLDRGIMMSASIFEQDGDLPAEDQVVILSDGTEVTIPQLTVDELSEKYATLSLNPTPAPPPPKNLTGNKKMQWNLARDSYNARISMGNRVFAGVSAWNNRTEVLGSSILAYLNMEDPKMSESESKIRNALRTNVLLAHGLNENDPLPDKLFVSNAQILKWKTNRYINDGWGSSLFEHLEPKQLLRELVMLTSEQNYMNEKLLSRMSELVILVAQQQAMLAKNDLNRSLR